MNQLLKAALKFRYKQPYFTRVVYLIVFSVLLSGCGSKENEKDTDNMKKIIFLHHSTGRSIWVGKTNRYIYKLTKKGDVQNYISKYNRTNKTNYIISESNFPQKVPYGWNNYPYDYYNIWVKNGGNQPYKGEPTLEILTPKYDVIILKHCFPVGRILEDTGNPDINSSEKRLENYKLQYNALKDKMHQFPNNKFIMWTPAASVKKNISEEEAKRTHEFYKWIMDDWNEEGDNIHIWDFYNYETEGTMYLLDKNAHSPENSHPGKEFAGSIAPLLGKYIIDVIESK
jgi:hypothetical protein